MAMTYVSTSTPMQGILMLREVIAKEPEFEPALFNLGILSIRSNQFGKAVERFKQILKINPANSKAALNLDTVWQNSTVLMKLALFLRRF
jgi:Tfp pilus assembly protein PilF